MNRVVRFLRRATAPAGGEEDGELLRRFVAAREEAAFAGLVRRHGAMVLGVCRRLLDDAHEAEDAFQATFLVLARRAAAVRKQDSVASWLYAVAYRVSLKARAAATHRQKPGGEAAEPASTADPAAEAAWRELRPVIDEELSRLPEKYRAPLVLCYLEGKTNEEAARLLGWTKGTVSGRLARARDLLRPRLARRGLALAAGSVAVLLAQRGAAPSSAALVETTANAVLTGSLSAPAAALARGVIRAMFVKKLTTLAALVVGLGIVSGGAGLMKQYAPGGEQPPKGKPGVVFTLPEEPKKEADDLQKLQGAWQAVALEHNGDKLSAEAVKKFRVVIKDNTITFDPDGNKREASFALGTESKPRSIFLKGDPKASLVRGIYDVTDKELKICFDNDEGKVTPTEFATKADSGLTLITLQRAAAAIAKAPEEKRYAFSMKNKPWKEVIDWFADQTGLAFSGTYVPKGTFTFTPPEGKQYSIPEIVDIINEALQAEKDGKYLLVRRTQTFSLVPADERLPDGNKNTVAIEDLPKYGKSEIVRVDVRLKSGKAADWAPQLRKLMSAWGDAIPIEQTNQLILIDRVANLQEMIKTLQAGGALEAKAPEEKRFTVEMKDKPWKDVTEWFADVSGLRYTGKETPPGTFTFSGPKDKQYTIPEIVDVINDALLADKKAPYLLIRRPKQPPAGTFDFVPADKRVPAVPRTDLEDLDKFGRTEIVWVMLKLKGGQSAEVIATLRKLQSPWGSATTSGGGLRMSLIDTTASVREIVKTLRAAGALDEDAAPRTFKGSGSPVRGVAYTPDGKTIWTCPEDGRVSAWDVATGKVRASLNADGNKWVSMAVSPDGKYVLCGGITQATEGKGDDTRKVDAGVMALYSAGLKSIWHEVSPSAVRAVAFSPDGKRVAGACDDGGILIRDAETGKAILAPGHGRQHGPLTTVAFSPDGKTLAAGSRDTVVRLWDVATGKELRALPEHKGVVTAVVFSPDGRHLLTACGDCAVQMWDVASGKELRQWVAATKGVQSVAFSPDGKLIATGGTTGPVALWDAVTGKELSHHEGHKGAVNSVAFSPDGKMIVTAGADGEVRGWGVGK
jgi:RNA polymerase sigma factor (sigma-70 family)